MSANQPNGRDPWSNRPNDGPPDITELFDKIIAAWRKLRGAGGGGGGSQPEGQQPWLLPALVAAFLLLSLAFEVVEFIEPAERGVVMRFGDPVRVIMPGMNFRLPRPIEFVERVNVDQVRSISHRAAMLTKDENIIEIEMAVQYRVSSIEEYLFNVRGPAETLHQAAETSIREVIGSSSMDHVLTSGRSQVAIDTTKNMQDLLSKYATGLVVDSVNILSVKPPDQVKSAFDDAIKAREDEQRLINEAVAYRAEVVPIAEGAAIRLVQESEAYSQEVEARARGEAARFSQLLQAYQIAPDITRERLQLETVEQVLKGANKVLMEGSSNNLSILPLDQLMGGGAATLNNARPAAAEAPMMQAAPVELETPAAAESRSRDRSRP